MAYSSNDETLRFVTLVWWSRIISINLSFLIYLIRPVVENQFCEYVWIMVLVERDVRENMGPGI